MNTRPTDEETARCLAEDDEQEMAQALAEAEEVEINEAKPAKWEVEDRLNSWWDELNGRRQELGSDPIDAMVISANSEDEAGELARALWAVVHDYPGGQARIGRFLIVTRAVDTLRNVKIFEDPLTPAQRTKLLRRNARRIAAMNVQTRCLDMSRMDR